MASKRIHATLIHLNEISLPIETCLKTHRHLLTLVLAAQRPFLSPFLTLYYRLVSTARKSKMESSSDPKSLLTIPPLQTRLCFTIKDHQLSRIPTSPKIHDGVNPFCTCCFISQTSLTVNWWRLSSVRNHVDLRVGVKHPIRIAL